MKRLFARVETLVGDETGVSPVIGVILMVSVTVIIAAVIGSTALGLGESVSESPPQAQFEVTEHDDLEWESDADPDAPAGPLTLELAHVGGEDIDPDDISVTVNGEEAYAVGPDGVDSQYSPRRVPTRPFQTQGPDSADELEKISAGDQTYLFVHTGLLVSDDPEGEYGIEPINVNNDDWDTIEDDGTFNSLHEDPLAKPLRISLHQDNNQGVNGWDSGHMPTNPEWGNHIHALESGDTLRVTWESGDSSQALYEYEING